MQDRKKINVLKMDYKKNKEIEMDMMIQQKDYYLKNAP